jgi:hypothetical protein
MEERPEKLGRIWRNEDGTFKAGHIGIGGRPKGKTLKEYAREYLMGLPADQKTEYLASLPAEIVWKMAEGLPQQDIMSGGEKINPMPIINVIQPNNSNQQNTETKQENQDNPGGDISQQDRQHTPILNSDGTVGQGSNADEHRI